MKAIVRNICDNSFVILRVRMKRLMCYYVIFVFYLLV